MFQAFVSASPTISFWYPRVSLGVQKQWLSIESLGAVQDLSKPLFLSLVGSTFMIPKGFMLDIDYQFTSKGSQRTYNLSRATHLLNISIRKAFLKDALSVEIKGTDIFKNRTIVEMYSGPYNMWQENINDTRDISLTIRYNFNSAKSKYKGTGAGDQQKNRL